jgi:gas vesicle protein
MSRVDAPGTIFTFILGVSVGALAALLLAPKAGEEMRADIAAGIRDGVNRIGAAGKKLNREAQKIVASAQDNVQDAIEAGQDAFRQAKKA